MARKNAPAKPRPGRPPKSGEATSCQVSVRLTNADRELLEAIQEQEQKAADALGITLGLADVLRIALRREAERRGLAPAALAGPLVAPR